MNTEGWRQLLRWFYQLRLWFLRWVLHRFCRWQYNVGAKIEESRSIPRTWELDRASRLSVEERFLKSWHKKQQRVERLLGKRLMCWMRKEADLLFYPTGEEDTSWSRKGPRKNKKH